MLTINEVKQIVSKLVLEDPSISSDDFIEDISCIIYRNDVFECDSVTINSRHIDIELSFGEYYEMHETAPAFQFICTLCNLSLPADEQEFILYQK